MAEKNCINVCFIGNPGSGKNTIIQGLIRKILPNHELGKSYQVCYSNTFSQTLTVNDYVNNIYQVNFGWGRNKRFNIFLTKYHNDQKMIIENIHLCDYIVYTIDSTKDFKEDIIFLEYMFKTIQDKNFLTKIIIVCNKYDNQFKNKIDEFYELITTIMNKYNLNNDYFYRIDARKIMIINIFRSTSNIKLIPESILHSFYNEYFGKLRANKLLTYTSDEIKRAFSELSLTDDEKNFHKYILSLPNNRDYFQEKCAVLTKQIIGYMDKNYEKDIDEYLNNITNFINDNLNIFTNQNKIVIYQTAFSKYYQLNTTQFRIDINFVDSVFLKLINFLKDDLFSNSRNDLKCEYFEKTLNKILIFNDPKNNNYIKLIEYSGDYIPFYQIFMNKYIPHAIEYPFYQYKITNPDETSDEEEEEVLSLLINNNENFMIILNYMIKFIKTIINRSLFDKFFYEKVLCNLKYPRECILKLISPLYKYSDVIYHSLVNYYRQERPEYLMKMKYNYVNNNIFIEYDELMDNPIIQLIKKIDDKIFCEIHKDYIFPNEIIAK